MSRWRRGRGKGRRRGPGRPMAPRKIDFVPTIKNFVPAIPKGTEINPDPIFLTIAELEVLRLVDLEGMMQEEAGAQMGVSRGTIWRLLQSARSKVAQMLTEGRELIIVPEQSET
ncbi:MAG: DUF134 domain-containing protein [Promethearchaeota archaeon]